MHVSLLKDYLPVNKCHSISVYWVFLPCDLLFPCIKALLFIHTTLEIQCTHFLIWRKGKLLHGSQASDSAKRIQRLNSCQIARMYKYLKTLHLQEALLKLQNVWNTKITLGYINLSFLGHMHYVFNHMIGVSIFVCLTTTQFNTENGLFWMSEGNLSLGFLPLQQLNLLSEFWANSKTCNGKTWNGRNGKSNLVIINCSSEKADSTS